MAVKWYNLACNAMCSGSLTDDLENKFILANGDFWTVLLVKLLCFME